MKSRASGILMPVFSLPSRYGIGCFDQEAYHFVDFLEKAGQTYWQILPLTPSNHGASLDSPYQSYSAFAGNPYFISLDSLVEEGVLSREECDAIDFGNDPKRVDYDKMYAKRLALLRKAYERSRIAENQDYQRFIREQAWWLDDYALFMACKAYFKDQEWTKWPEDISRHWHFAIDYYNRTLYFDIEFHKYAQFKFFQQWYALKAYANSRHIQVIGDIPIYVAMDSADVWAHSELFQLDGDNYQTAVAGCPPDAFSADGQVWGTPLYRWEKHREDSYGWWMARLWMNFQQCDLLRIDHFRGLDEYFSIPASTMAAADGHWEKGPGMGLFRQMWQNMGFKPVIVEDLGYMTDSVRALVQETGFPNMKVLQFGFDEKDFGAANDYLPHNIPEHCIVYPGTHDNAPVNGWFGDLSKSEKTMVRNYLGAEKIPDQQMNEVVIREALKTRAETCVISLQDWLGLGNEGRINLPSTLKNNWNWRLEAGKLTAELSAHIFEMTRRYGRLNWDADSVQDAVKLW